MTACKTQNINTSQPWLCTFHHLIQTSANCIAHASVTHSSLDMHVAHLGFGCLIARCTVTGVGAGVSPARSSVLGPAAGLSLSLNPLTIVCRARNEPTQRSTKPGSRQPTAPLTPNRPLSSPCTLAHVCACVCNQAKCTYPIYSAALVCLG